jgi:hypothetical protein
LIFANKQAAQKSLAKYMRTNDQEVLEYSYQHYLKRTPKKPYPTMMGIQFLLDMAAPQMPQAKTAKPQQFVDLSFLRELENDGFYPKKVPLTKLRRTIEWSEPLERCS